MTLVSLQLSPSFTALPEKTVFFYSTLLSLPVFFFHSLSAEWYLVWAVLLRCVQGHEPHAVHRLRQTGPGESLRYLAHHAEYDCGSYLLCCFHWPRNRTHPVAGLLQTAVSGKGEERNAVLFTTPVLSHFLHVKKDASLLFLQGLLERQWHSQNILQSPAAAG